MWEHFERSGVAVDEGAQLGRVLRRLDCARIVTVGGADVGLLKVRREGDPWELMQVQLAPEWQGRGLGRALVERILAEAASARASVELDVLVANPARRLYERLGFRVVATEGASHRMRWDPPGRGAGRTEAFPSPAGPG